jgi:hypothetical protein
MERGEIQAGEDPGRQADEHVDEGGREDPAMGLADSHRRANGGKPGEKSKPSGCAAEPDLPAHAFLLQVGDAQTKQHEAGKEEAEHVAEHDSGLGESQQSEIAAGGAFPIGDAEQLGDGQRAEEQVKAVAAGFGVLAGDDHRGKEAEGDAEEGGARAETAAQSGHQDEIGAAHADGRVEAKGEIADPENVRPGPGRQVEERHAGSAEAGERVHEVPERVVAHFDAGEDLVGPLLLFERKQNAGTEQREHAERRKEPAVEGTLFNCCGPRLSRFGNDRRDHSDARFPARRPLWQIDVLGARMPLLSTGTGVPGYDAFMG